MEHVTPPAAAHQESEVDVLSEQCRSDIDSLLDQRCSERTCGNPHGCLTDAVVTLLRCQIAGLRYQRRSQRLLVGAVVIVAITLGRDPRIAEIVAAAARFLAGGGG